MPPKPPAPTDIARVRELAEALKALGMRVSALVVGDVRIVLAEPWGGERPATTRDAEQASFVTDSTKATEADRLVRLRKASKKQFGRVLPDAALLKLDGVL